MITQEITVQNKKGIHARPASHIVQAASKFSSRIHLIRGNDEINAKSIIGILTLGAVYKSKLVIQADGEDEEQAIQKLTIVFSKL